MTLIEFCEKVGGDYETLMTRISSEDKAIKYLKMFKVDPSFSSLHEFLDSKEYVKAFEAVHTLKGVSGNLSLNRLYDVVCELTEILRHYNGEDYIPSLTKVDEAYKLVIENIELL